MEEPPPNILAYLAMFAWPVISYVAVRRARGKMSIARISAWLLCLGLMFLPSGASLDAPGIPEIDKFKMPALSLLVALRLVHGPFAFPETSRRFNVLLLGMLVWSTLGTVLTNQDPLLYGPTRVVALRNYDIVSVGATLLFDWYVPFLVGQLAFRTEQDVIDLFDVLTLCCVGYLPLVLIEVRLSPQFHVWIYGNRPSSFLQAIRAGGFRPQVFFHHGLSLALFAFMGVVAAAGLRRAGVSTTRRPRTRARTWWTAILMASCKSLGSFLYAFFSAALVLFSSPRTIARVIVVIIAIVISYPTSRSTGLFPTKELVQVFRDGFSADRAESLDFRFINEDALLAKATLRPTYGFGTFGRGRVYSDEGRDISITDGHWAIVITTFGYFGFFVFFAMSIIPLVRYLRQRKRMPERAQHLVGALALILAFATLDLLPNGLWSSLPLAFAGGLFSLTDRVTSETPAAVPAPIRRRARGRVFA